MISALEAATGMDVDGDGQVGDTPPASSATSPPSSAPAEDPIAKLERLAKLRDEGVLTDEAFAAQKRRLLGG